MLANYNYVPLRLLAEEPSAKIKVELHPQKRDLLRLYLPNELLSRWLPTVKNIAGRRWNPSEKVWEIPYTKTKRRFLEHYLKEVVQIDFIPHSNLPDKFESVLRVQRRIQKSLYTPARYEAAVVALEE